MQIFAIHVLVHPRKWSMNCLPTRKKHQSYLPGMYTLVCWVFLCKLALAQFVVFMLKQVWEGGSGGQNLLLPVPFFSQLPPSSVLLLFPVNKETPNLTHPCHLDVQSFHFLFPFGFNLAPFTHIFWQLRGGHFITCGLTTVKGFLIWLEVGRSFSAQGRIFVFLLVWKSQNTGKVSVSQTTFWFLVFEILMLNKWFPLS